MKAKRTNVRFSLCVLFSAWGAVVWNGQEGKQVLSWERDEGNRDPIRWHLISGFAGQDAQFLIWRGMNDKEIPRGGMG